MISELKIKREKELVIKNCQSCGGNGCGSCLSYVSFIDRMVDANIPADYWRRNFNQFYGNPEFKERIADYIGKLDENYDNGNSLMLVGHPGTGKSFAACSVLKAALLKGGAGGYSSYYITLSDAVSSFTSYYANEFRNNIKAIDFYVLDEVDPRFFPTEGSRELFANCFENIVRTRLQNKLPIIICTNETNVDEMWSGMFKETIGSLASQFITTIYVGGKDVRKMKGKNV